MQETLNILIADDDGGDRKQIRRALNQSGLACTCTETAGIGEALEACDKRGFDVAIVDYRLPGEDGLAGITALHERLPWMSIIMVTGQGDEIIATEAMRRGASDYIPKAQVTAETIRSAVEESVKKTTLLRTVAQRREASDGQLAERTLQLEASDRRKQIDQDLISKLNAALSGKTVLLQEVHHRIKNNLAVIGALLGMQADTLSDELAIIALPDSQRRVESMALIHEYLYGSEHLDRVDFGQYVKRLTDQLAASYAIEPDLVSIRIAAETIDLPMNQAMPCALITNELLSNALKYAYPRGHTGEINVQFALLESGKLSLSCQDRGKGIPETFDWKNSSSLGLRIIQILTKQLKGELTLDRNGGTKFELQFPASA